MSSFTSFQSVKFGSISGTGHENPSNVMTVFGAHVLGNCRGGFIINVATHNKISSGKISDKKA